MSGIPDYPGIIHYDYSVWNLKKKSFYFLQIRIWNITPSQVNCIRSLGGHSNVIMRLIITSDRAASRDLDGNILVWDMNKAIEGNYAIGE